MNEQSRDKIFVICARSGNPKMAARASVICRNPNLAILDYSAGVLGKGQVVGFTDREWSELAFVFPVTIVECES